MTLAVSDYQRCAKHIEQARHSIDTHQPFSRIKADCLQAATTLISYCRISPYGAVALIRASQQPGAAAALLRHGLMLAIIGCRLRFSEPYLSYLLAATLHARAIPADNRTQRQQLQRLLRHPDLSIWADVMRLSKICTGPLQARLLGATSLTNSQRWVLISQFLSCSSAQACMLGSMESLLAHIPPAFRQRLSPLVQFPGECLAGLRIRVGHTDYDIVAQLRGRHGLVSQGAEDIAARWRQLSASQMVNPQALNMDQWLQSYQRAGSGALSQKTSWPFTPGYVVSRPPAHLLRIIDLLHQPDTNVSKLVTEITREPAFARFLTLSASQDNRMQLPVADLKQAILTYGLTRVGDMLIHQALTERLTQKTFPLQGLFNQLATLTANLASHLATITDAGLNAQSAALLASFSTAPLFTTAKLKISRHYHPGPERLHDPTTLLGQAKQPPVAQLCADLAIGWHQPPQHIGILRQWGKLPAQSVNSTQKPFSLLVLSLVWARKWLFGHNAECEASDEAVAQARHILALGPEIESSLAESFSHLLFWPLTER